MMAAWIRVQGFSVSQAGSLREARLELSVSRPDLVLLDLQLPDGNGLSLLREEPRLPSCDVVLITGHATLDTSIEALRLGAVDYLIKPVSEHQLKGVLSRVSRPEVLQAELASLATQWEGTGSFGHLVGKAPSMTKIYKEIAKVASTAITVLVSGQSGTGKELVAHTLHDLSRRRNAPFVAVNCGAISPQLMESEFFGHEKGSFTGADRQHRGFFERAEGGTLFLDEVTEMPVELQVKLLRVLETRSYMRVGSSQVRETDIRVVAATNRDPEQAVERGTLREDLWYRLNVFPIKMPALRDRADDIILLARTFLSQICSSEGSEKEFSPLAIHALQSYRWPGNVRELRNTIQRAYVQSDSDLIEIDWLSVDTPVEAATQVLPSSQDARVSILLGTPLATAERQLIIATLAYFDNHKERTAAALGISLKTLYNKLKDYEKSPEFLEKP